MGRKARKNVSKSGAGGAHESESSDDDSLFKDDASFLSDGSFFREEATAVGEEEGDVAPSEIFEEKLKEALDQATQKSAAGRVAALKNLCRGLLKRMVPEFVAERRVTFTDLVERALKRGKEDELRAASILSVLVCAQLGLDETAEAVYTDLKPTLLTQMQIPTASQKSRAAMASALGLLAFLQCPAEETQQVMTELETVFRSPTAGADLQTEALSAWTLLCTLIQSYQAIEALRGPLAKYLSVALESSDVDLRIAAGEAVAVLYELADDEAAMPETIVDKVRELSTDSNKYRSRKDRKEQRSTFRDVAKTLDGEDAIYQIKMVKTNDVMERLVLDSWKSKKQYDSFRKVLSMDVYLQKSEVIRDIFELGPPKTAVETKDGKPTKQAKQLMYKHMEKVRNQHRAKQRSSHNRGETFH